ncbi:ABC-F type ribosomal protection protein [Ruminiclostridium herbifermentans]|uniref:ABC-F type ribosomal protection protein n=1 Tax=Ruminiclostridium herbifermentans TaxID=2488810 RepID=A0A4U7JIM2_9FIRM|nr:ABC-F type ribosomal protection protein [Ruminiclostridium herbifermentans]QNU65308.1 ABC-F type ribosomal protection protein [Ruminiclostridium herbifermentans]
MLIIDAINVKKNFLDREILSFDKLQIRSGDKIGVVGNNGAGKTTLLNILAGELIPDEGIIRRYCDIAYIKQISNEMIEADYELLSQFNVKNKLHKPVVSGGEKTRLKIAGAFSKNSVVIFADEPTANLDYKGIELLKKKLLKTETLLLISHDRELLDSLCNKIIEVENGKLSFFEGSYSVYKQQKQKILERERFEYENYIAEKKHLEEAIINRKAHARTIKKTPSRMGNSEARLHKRSSNEKQEKIHDAAKIMESRLNKLEIKEKPKEQPNIKLDFSLTNPPQNKLIISANNFSFSYGQVRIFNNIKFDVYNGKKHAIIGDNGTGKTTLLNEIYKFYQKGNLNASDKDLNLKSINIVPKARIAYFCQDLDNLNLQKSILDNVMSESVQNETTVRTILARLLFIGDSVYKKVGILSGGERVKVSFAKLFVSNSNVLLLDEPTNYLDIPSIEALQSILSEYEGTVLFVSHDRTFVDSIAERLLVIKNGQVLEHEGNLTDYQNKNKSLKENTQTQKLLLEMRITELISKLKDSNNDQKLEAEYQELVSKLKQF